MGPFWGCACSVSSWPIPDQTTLGYLGVVVVVGGGSVFRVSGLALSLALVNGNVIVACYSQ